MEILFVRLSAIGDVIQAAAALCLYREAYPNARITWAVDETLVPLVSGFGVAERVIGINASGLFRGSLHARIGHLFKAMTLLGLSGRYEAVYCAHPDWRFTLLSRFVRTKQRFSPRAMSRSGGFIANRYRVFEYFRLLTNQDAGTLPVDRALAAIGSAAISSKSNVRQTNFDLPERYVALVPGGARNALRDDPLRRWPIENYVQLAGQLQSLGHPIVLLGGPDDHWVSANFSELNVCDLVGKTSLIDMLGVLNKASCVVVHDSGPLHLASVTSSPMVAIFGPTPANAVASFSRPKTSILQSENRVSCSPCYDGRGYARCESNICMQAITVDQVLSAVTRLASGA